MHALIFTIVLLGIGALAVLPVLLGVLERRAQGERRSFIRGVAAIALWISFNLSFCTMIGVFIVRGASDWVPAFMLGLGLLQPLALWLSHRVVFEGSDGSGD